MINTACYIRVSSDRQVKEGESVPAQREAVIAHLLYMEMFKMKRTAIYINMYRLPFTVDCICFYLGLFPQVNLVYNGNK